MRLGPIMLPRVRTLAIDASLVLAFAVTLLVVGSTLYLLVSFAVMKSHTEPRPFLRSLRAFIGEVVAIAITQPLIPLFYVVGRRMGRARRPGHLRPRVLPESRRLRLPGARHRPGESGRSSASTTTGANPSPSAPSGSRELHRYAGETGAATGRHCRALAGRRRLARVRGDACRAGARPERCVTIASPHAGVRWRGFALGTSARQLRATSEYMRTNMSRAVPIRALSIYSSHDNIVHPSST